MAVEFKCDGCGELSALRQPRFMTVGLPLIVAGCMFIAFYVLVPADISWYSPTALLLNVLMIFLEVVVTLIISRIMKRFEKRRADDC